MSYIAAIETSVPEHMHTQKEFTTFYANSTEDVDVQRKIKIIASKTGIEKRYSVLKDFNAQPEDFEFFPKDASLLPEPGLSKRMEIFNKEALQLSIKTISKIPEFDHIKNTITHLITVTCTGLFAPGLDIQLIQALALKPSINRSSINFMGCNAAILALKQADVICKANGNANVLIVCTELCSIHFQKDYSDDYIISNQLFGDGCAVVLVTADPVAYATDQLVKINEFHSLLLHKGYNDMAWQLSETGFRMNLTTYVSDLINGNIKQMLADINVDANAINFWAVHPGGRKIIDGFCAALQLDKGRLEASYDILKNFGNMSSPTILFVLKQVLDGNKESAKGKALLTAAFGPGLSIETLTLVYA